MPDPAGATPPLDEAGCARCRASCTGSATTRPSTVIITSRHGEELARPGPPDRGRRAEPGRGRPVRRTPAGPLPGRAGSGGSGRSFGELLEWLDGHPLAMRLTLPRLDTTDPAALLAGLRGTTPLPGRGCRAGPADVAGGEHHLLLRPPDRASQAAAPGRQPVPRHRRRRRPDAVLCRGGGAGPVRRDQQAGVDGGAGGRGPGRAADRDRRRHVPDPPGPARLPRRRLARRQPRRLRGGTPGSRAGPAHRLRRLQRLADRADRHPATPPLPTRSSGCSGGPWERCSATPWTTDAWADAERIVRALDAYWDTRGLSRGSRRLGRPHPGHHHRPRPEAARNGRIAVVVHPRPAGQPTDERWATGQGRPGLPTDPRLAAGPARNRMDPQEHLRLLPPARRHRPGAGTAGRSRRLVPQIPHHQRGTRRPPGHGGTYHQLGITADHRGRLEEADDWYRKALTI